MTIQKYYDLNQLPDIFDRTERQEWLVDGILPKNSLTIFTGATGCGKSSVLLALASCVAKGEPFIGRQTLQTPVLIADKENPIYVYTERFERFGITRQENMKFWGLWDPELAPLGPEYIGVREFVKEHKPLVIYDSLVAFHPSSEQDASETRSYLHHFRELTALGATVVVIHHTGKSLEGASKNYRGSSDIPAAADCCWLLEQKGKLLQKLYMTCFKSREGSMDNIALCLDGKEFVTNEFVEDNDPVYHRIDGILVGAPNSNQSEINTMLPDVSRHKVLKMLNLGVGSGRYQVTTGRDNSRIYTLTPRAVQKSPDNGTRVAVFDPLESTT